MLVLSRKENQTVCFPNLGIAVEILRIAGNAVRVGIQAPRDVPILRGELTDGNDEAKSSAEEPRRTRHELRNRLNSANLALHVLQKQLEQGLLSDAEQTLTDALNSFENLDRLASNECSTERRENTATSKRALVVEDNANERELLAGYLRLCGYEVDTAEDGLAAMSYLSNNANPDIVLLDMQMPRLDGIKTVSAIRGQSEYRDIKLFAVSGMDRCESGITLGDRGVDRWFSKPLKPSEFARELEVEVSKEYSMN